MKEKLRAETFEAKETNRVITFPLYIPVVIVVGIIILFSNISRKISISETTTIPENIINPLGPSIEKKEELNGVIEIFNAKNFEVESNNIEEDKKEEINTVQNEEKNVSNTKKEESTTEAKIETKNEKEKINTTIGEENNSTKDKIYTSSNGEKYTIIGKLSIPTLNIKSNILSSTSDALMKIALNKYWGPNPNEVGNMVVVGHNYKGSKFFGKLYNIKKGDTVKITDSNGKTVEYKVYDKYVIDPYDNKCTSQLTDGKTEITLITCYNNGQNRLVVKARANI